MLDAAEVVLTEQGAWRLTLDAVAEQAQVSKGGLLYHFPTKDALLQALVDRLAAKAASKRQDRREDTGGDPESVLRNDVECCLIDDDRNPQLCAALISAHHCFSRSIFNGTSRSSKPFVSTTKTRPSVSFTRKSG